MTTIDSTLADIIKNLNLDVEIIEEPGTGLPCAQCAYCSRSYLMYDVEKEEAIPVPATCERCKAPMNWDAVHGPGGFAEKQTELAMKGPPNKRRDKMVREPAASKSGGKR